MNVPQLRFNGFDGEWETAKLRNYLNFIGSGVTPRGGSSVYQKSEGVILIRSQNVHFAGLKLEDIAFITTEINEKMKKSEVYNLDVLLNITGASIGRTAMVPLNFPKANVNQHVCILRPDKHLAPFFLKTFLESSKGQKNVFRDQAGQTREALNLEQIKNFSIGIPQKNEQKKISEFFMLFNRKIEKQQEKVEKIEQFKKGMMMKIFSRELRFKDEDGGEFPEWEVQTLNNFTKRVVRKNKGIQSTRPLTISAQMGLVDQKEFFNKNVASANTEGYYLLENGEFAYNKSYSNGYPWGAIKRLDKYEDGVLSTLYICFEPLENVDSDFLSIYFETTFWYKEVSLISGEGARNHGLLNIGVNDFFETKHKLPSIKEQRKIAEVFMRINRKIEKEKEKLMVLDEQKKGFMWGMFI